MSDSILSTNFTVTISTFPEEDALKDVTYAFLSRAVTAFQYAAELPDPTDEYDEDELDGDGDGEVIASADEFDDEPSHDDAVDEALETLQELITPEQILGLDLSVSAKVIRDLKDLYEAQDVAAVTEVLITYYDTDGEPVFYHTFSGYISPVRTLDGNHNGGSSDYITLHLEMDVAEVRTFCLENPSPAKPVPLIEDAA